MGKFLCEQCNSTFKRDKQGSRKIRFCSQICYRLWRKENNVTTGQFGTRPPWNKGLKGIHCSPQSEFKKGMRGITWVPLGTISVRKHRYEGPRNWIKVSEPNVWKPHAIYIWELHNGSVPAGYVIHHIDRDTLNDDLSNLVCMSRAKHMQEHRLEFEPSRLEGLRRLCEPDREDGDSADGLNHGGRTSGSD